MMDRWLRFLWKLFVRMLIYFVISVAVKWIFVELGIGFDGPVMLLIPVLELGMSMFLPLCMIVPVIILLLVLRYIRELSENGRQRQMHRAAPPQSNEKAKSQPLSRYEQIDSVLNGLNDSERIYLQSRLGSSELVVSDDGELVTMDEYRKQKGAK